MRDSASWYIGCSRITELPSRECDEDVVERGVMRGEQRQLHAAVFEQGEQRGEGAVQLYDRERDSVGTRPHRGHPAHLSKISTRSSAIPPSVSAKSTTWSAPSDAISSLGVPWAMILP